MAIDSQLMYVGVCRLGISGSCLIVILVTGAADRHHSVTSCICMHARCRYVKNRNGVFSSSRYTIFAGNEMEFTCGVERTPYTYCKVLATKCAHFIAVGESQVCDQLEHPKEVERTNARDLVLPFSPVERVPVHFLVPLRCICGYNTCIRGTVGPARISWTF